MRCADVPDENANPGAVNVSTYLIGKPRASHYSLFGRGTRGYVAWHIEKERWVFLKDMWKNAALDVPFELEVYMHLKGVEYIPTAIGGGPVGSPTKAQDLFPDTDRPATRVHCRLVLEEVAQPLEDYKDASHLVVILEHALQGLSSTAS